jgi:hypothetical protein
MEFRLFAINVYSAAVDLVCSGSGAPQCDIVGRVVTWAMPHASSAAQTDHATATVMTVWCCVALQWDAVSRE